MSLPWFPFNIKDFVTNTLRLNTEAKGAYLMLILDYYQTETAPPDDDEVLAAVTGLSIEAWKRHRRVIAPLFEIKDGVWRHTRIEEEMRDASEKHAARIAQRIAASEARWGKKTPTTSGPHPARIRPASGPDTGTEKKTPRNPRRNAEAIRPASEPHSGTETQTQTQVLVEGGGDARAREPDPVSVSEIEDRLTDTQPVSLGVPIDHWTPDFVHPADVGLLNEFCRLHEERGTFSKDWPSLWQKHLDDAKAPKPAKKRTVPPRIETDKRPEQPVGVRVLISQEAFALADEIAKDMGVEGQPITVGMPSQIQTWMASWSADTIRLAIQKVMARRPDDPPGSMKYFENAIAREHAERQRPLPVAKIAPAQEITIHGKERSKTKSLPEAADRLVDRIAALSGGGSSDGSGESAQPVGSIPQIGSA